jgi:hypothetical protein
MVAVRSRTALDSQQAFIKLFKIPDIHTFSRPIEEQPFQFISRGLSHRTASRGERLHPTSVDISPEPT